MFTAVLFGRHASRQREVVELMDESTAGLPASVAGLIDESMALGRAGDIAAALGQAREALDLARRQGEPGAIAEALVSVARFRHRLGQYPTARALAEEALTVASRETRAQADALLMLAMGAAETEHLVVAEDYYRRAADLAREIGEHLLRFHALHNLGTTVYVPRGQVAESTGDQGLGVNVRMGMSRYHRLAGNEPAARDWADGALSIARRTCYHHQQGQALIERGRALLALGECDAAEADWREAIDILTSLQANFDLARAALFLAALLHSQQRLEARPAWQDTARKIHCTG